MPSYWLGTVTKTGPVNGASGVALNTHFFGDVDNAGGDDLVLEIRVRSTHAVVVHTSVVAPTGSGYDFGEFSSFLTAGVEYEWDIWDSFFIFGLSFGDGTGGTFTFTTEAGSSSSASSSPVYFRYDNFIVEAKTGNALAVVMTDTYAPVSFQIRAVWITLSAAAPMFDLGMIFFPKDVLNSESLKNLVRIGKLQVIRGTVRLDADPKYPSTMV